MSLDITQNRQNNVAQIRQFNLARYKLEGFQPNRTEIPHIHYH